MRSIVYVVAALCAIGIAIGIARMPQDAPQDSPVATTRVMNAPGSVVMNVPDMMCEFSCFPRIKETLESESNVKEVALGPQKEEGTVDNRQVIVSYESGFDVDQAIELLKAEGFDNSEIVQ